MKIYKVTCTITSTLDNGPYEYPSNNYILKDIGYFSSLEKANESIKQLNLSMENVNSILNGIEFMDPENEAYELEINIKEVEFDTLLLKNGDEKYF